MSRENKLALVLGFGLILFVGILISDHFSVASHQRAAEMGGITDPLVRTRQADAELIDYQSPAEPAADREAGPRYTPATLPTAGRDYADSRGESPSGIGQNNDEARRVTMGEPAHQLVGLPARQARELPYTPHHVRSGESLSSICRDHYGDPSLADDLARYNDIRDPRRIREGHRLRLPPVEQLVRGTTAASAPLVKPPSQGQRTYTIQPGDNLSEIAKRLLGSARRYHELYELNRDVLADPDNLVVGTKIRIPST